MSDTPEAADEKDPIEEVVERLADEAIAPWAKLLSPAKLARMRELLVEGLATHPASAPLVKRLAAAPRVEASGEVDKTGAAAAVVLGRTIKR